MHIFFSVMENSRKVEHETDVMENSRKVEHETDIMENYCVQIC